MIPVIGLIIAASQARNYIVTTMIATIFSAFVLTEVSTSQHQESYSQTQTQPQGQQLTSIDNTAQISYSDTAGNLFNTQTNPVSVLLIPTESSTLPSPSPVPTPTPSPGSEAKTPPFDGEIAVPNNVHATTGVMKNMVRLDWDGAGQDVVGYRIYRNNISIGTTDSSLTFYNDSLHSLGRYEYVVRAYNSQSQYSEPSTSVSVIADLTIDILSL